MEKLGVLEWCIIGFIIFAKFGVIIAAAFWSRRNQEKKRQLFMQQHTLWQTTQPDTKNENSRVDQV